MYEVVKVVMNVSLMLFQEQIQPRARITPNALARRPGIHPCIAMDIYYDINAATPDWGTPQQ